MAGRNFCVKDFSQEGILAEKFFCVKQFLSVRNLCVCVGGGSDGLAHPAIRVHLEESILSFQKIV